ncbi:MAG: ribosome maturation factor RimP [Filomicrobium sp.]
MAERAVAPCERFVRETGLAAALAELVEPVLEDLGFRLVRAKVDSRGEATVQIMAERPDGTISVDDCELISRQLSPLLDVHDLVPGTYRLEISSPGIDRLLVRASDFDDWSGHEAKLELSELIDGRKRFRGQLQGYQDGEALIEVELPEVGATVLGLPLNLIREAKLVLTDELIREALTRAKKQKRGDNAAGPVSPGDELDLED